MEFNTLTTTLTNFVGVFQGGYARLQPIVNSLLGILAGIDIVLIGFWWALGGGERLVEVIKKVLFLGFWLWFTTSFQANAKAFVESLINAGLTAGGQASSYNLLLDPSRIAGYGLTATDHTDRERAPRERSLWATRPPRVLLSSRRMHGRFRPFDEPQCCCYVNLPAVSAESGQEVEPIWRARKYQAS